MPRMWLIGGAALVAVLLVASIVVALVEQEEALPEGTPERTLQRFLLAVEDEDFRAAYDLLSAQLKQICAFEEFAGTAYGGKAELRNSRVTLEDTRYLDGTALVIARVTRISSSGPFGTSEWSHDEHYRLILEEGEWRFTEYPWPHYGCTVSRVEVPLDVPAPSPEHTPTVTVEGR